MKPGVVVTYRGGQTKFWEPDGLESRVLRLAKQRRITVREALRIIEQEDEKLERDWGQFT